MPILPPRKELGYFLSNIFFNMETVVDFPLEPVIPIIFPFVNLYANSISLIMGIL